MSENQQFPGQDNGSKSTKGPVQASSSTWKRWMAKKWVFPAIYMCAAVAILSLMWVYQSGDKKASQPSDTATTSTVPSKAQQDAQQAATDDSIAALPVTGKTESLAYPADRSAVQVVMPFYDVNGSQDERLSAMIEYDNQFIPNTGISLAASDKQPFDVLAAMSGKVTRVATLPAVGTLVEITHDDGLKTVYQSVSDVSVAQGDQVKQGQVIAKAGRNEMEASLGVHLHFEVLKDGNPVDPESVLAKS